MIENGYSDQKIEYCKLNFTVELWVMTRDKTTYYVISAQWISHR
jgi:hypothetical protein